MNYITDFHLLNFKRDGWFILGRENEYVDHININDLVEVKIEVRKQGDETNVDYPIIQGKVKDIRKAMEWGFGNGERQLVTAIGLHIDIETAEYLKSIINKLEHKYD